ncbi:UDP-N-acetylmuramate dehydrogenase [Lacibacter cauensis]|uniref:UDP-N-acetylenolpyruvoylglucosamine reductase n=1 Tax=Lacibacter cauensis TaxID=510947 RepID=A0A562SDX9_9BACT|nr:UDP-N-acetylmuramate dehydrogenase [Lacibacter cauensis]TWI79323.1 UDP-N-acetylmuramate dehydrogenase [Lacibacter cauensis]
MQIHENLSLRQYNTFGIDAKAKLFADFNSVTQLQEILQYVHHLSPRIPRMILGGGSNVLFTQDVHALVLKNGITGIELVKEDEQFVYVKVGAGVNWHSFVLHCVQQGWAGVENLSLIPGNAGASPMQNIGAYGAEIKDVFEELEAYHLNDKTVVRFSAADCAFGYRESVFKRKFKDQFVILTVTYRLRKNPIFQTSYGAINEELEKMGVKELSIAAISQAVINIRSSKLPDPKQIGNAGSFFKNPSISKEQYDQLKNEFAQLVAYVNADGTMKLAAGWLIEQCGWKGYRKGDAGCHAKQALVLVNYGKATGKEIYELSEEILQSVKAKFGVELEREVNIV